MFTYYPATSLIKNVGIQISKSNNIHIKSVHIQSSKNNIYVKTVHIQNYAISNGTLAYKILLKIVSMLRLFTDKAMLVLRLFT